MKLVLFEDSAIERLYPITLTRPAFAISCGGYRLAELVARLDLPCCVVVREHLTTMVAEDFGFAPHDAGEPCEQVLLVNARAVPSVGTLRVLEALKRLGVPKIVRGETGVAAALVDVRQTPPPEPLAELDIARWLLTLEIETCTERIELFEYPHDVLRYHLQVIHDNLADRLAQGEYQQLQDGLFVADDVRLGEYLVVDASEGPVVVESGAQIGPFCLLQGPLRIGARSRVIEHSALKDAVVLGHTTKVGGEVEGSIIEAYTNKQHHGFIGHSYLGSWVNLGAGTCNSDLKNTYGTVSMEYRGKRVATGMQFVGCVIGDYSKTAVNTSIFTGKVIGACSMAYGFVTTNVPSFTNYARTFGQISEIPVEVALAGQQRMFKRRHVAQRPCDIELLHAVHRLTAHERQLSNEPLSL